MELTQRQQQVLYDKKWKTFLRRSWLFRYVPFVEFAVAAGSMALGNVRDESDFDVIVGVRNGRIFTARFFAILAFGLFGWRRQKLNHDETAKDKICLNHFVTTASYLLSPPHSPYWQKLYRMLVPLYGTPQALQAFFDANTTWMPERVMVSDDLRHRHRAPSWFKMNVKEAALSGRFGDLIERLLKRVQVRRIERSMRSDAGYKPRIIYNDTELEFHPDTKRIELLEKNL